MTSIIVPPNGGAMTQTDLEGIKLGMPFEQYKRTDGVNHSNAKEIDLSPRHYLQKISAPEEEPTDAQVIGKITHSAILENDFSGFVVRPRDMTFQTKEGKAWRDAQTKPIITQEVASNIAGMVVAVKNHTMASRILYTEKGNNEVSCWKKHPMTELLLKGRADRVTTDNQERTTVVDLKTCERGDACIEKFRREIRKWKYHSQAAWYLDLFGASFFVFIVVEKEAPFGICCYHLGARSMQKGRELNDKRLSKIRECAESGKWPDYSDEIVEIEIPEIEFQKGNNANPSLKYEWDNYFRLCFPDGCSKQQETDVKRAFYAGTLTVLTACVELTAMPDEEAAAEGVGKMMKESLDTCADLAGIGESDKPHLN